MSDIEAVNEECSRVYEHMKLVFGGIKPGRRREQRTPRPGSAPFAPGRDPHGISDVLGSLTNSLGWETQLAKSDLVARWADVAGEQTAAHSTPVDISAGVLTVQCESTAWATQLRLMRVELQTQITTRFPEAQVTTIRFLGPNVPSFKRGPRSVQGRGVRDTYG
ncbi:DUF721 domain-containing protein [Mycetocola reblochoni]|uniref:Zn-ribbon-containing, possibly RNA-binding protein and truncated derivatives n=2 Tax=Mycetocola reblochoni TaxID=331618 RepID=A0A1R4JFH3_9MICO|nr:DciA family protein [Mycetocola reblochoni]RLP67735.1 DUF721 domain-containing protein [Mycetocola reblochoni]SJN30768.1 Zn-ribbon-containing, possibly RNA-binding protein and truncated derivatives [Mycetocola reblochoni REB411]